MTSTCCCQTSQAALNLSARFITQNRCRSGPLLIDPVCNMLYHYCRAARLFIVGNGQGSPCLDLRRVPDTLADATVGADLVVLEGMGRSIITNYNTLFR